jgi:hypothetical protein
MCCAFLGRVTPRRAGPRPPPSILFFHARLFYWFVFFSFQRLHFFPEATLHASLFPFHARPTSPCSPPFFFSLVINNIWSCLALQFNFALLFDCANPSIECSLPKTPQSSTPTRFHFARQSLLQAFAGSTSWLQVAPVCLVRLDKNLITAL